MEQDLMKSVMEMLGMIKTDKEEHYEEIKKLDTLLTEANIPHDFHPAQGGFQITYYGKNGKPKAEPGVIRGAGVGAICSAIETPFSYGHENDTIEISGLMTEEERRRQQDTVMGNLSAEDVFERIRKDWERSQSITTLVDASQSEEIDEVDGVEIDGTWYNILDIIDDYYYLINLDNRDDFILMKEDGDEMVSITDEDEYVRVLNMFNNKLINL